jgi:chromosome condensin MukBEF MukE localization factor
MEMLREAYVGMPIVMQNVDISEDVAKEFERLKKCGVMVQIENQPSKVDFISNAVFQFPQDDEIEV